uniref:NEDD4-binding protein 2-like 1 n=1 Tax=Romanomermis culicivorax TaxID=13658 RepID=A0A915HGY7_ROMCU
HERPTLFTNVKNSQHSSAAQNTRPNTRRPRVSQTEFIENVIKQQRFVLVILRGPSGSGKTTLANRLKTPDGIICNTDEYFVDRNGVYNFQGSRAMESKLSPVIIDNTNCFAWEMLPYVRAGQNHGYEIFFLVPETPWALNAKECARRNIHGIKEEKIDAFIRNFKLDVRLRDFDPSNAIKKPPDRRKEQKNKPESTLSPENRIEHEKTLEQDLESRKRLICGSSNVDLWDYANSELRNMDDSVSVVSEQIISLETPAKEEYQSLASDFTERGASESNIVQKAQKPKSHFKRHHHKTPADLAAHNVLLNTIKNKKPTTSTTNSLLFGDSILPEILNNNRWTLSNDVILGSNLTPGSSFDENSDSDNPCPTPDFVTFEVSHKCSQVTESAIEVTYLKYSRLEVNCSPDDSFTPDRVDEFCTEENYFELKRPVNSGKILQCNKSSQTVFEEIDVKIEHTDSESVQEVIESSKARENDCTTTIESAMDTLRILFPDVPDDDLCHILDNCAQDPEWASNVLLESGYEMTFSKKNFRNSDDETRNEKNATTEKSSVHPNSAESICCTVELSIDMASQLQELFGRVHNDLPAELLNPRQLKIDVPLDLAGKLFQHWLKTQSSPEYTDPNQMRDDEIYSKNKRYILCTYLS